MKILKHIFLFMSFIYSSNSFSNNFINHLNNKNNKYLYKNNKFNSYKCYANVKNSENEAQTNSHAIMGKPLTIRFHTHITSETCSRLVEALTSLDLRSKQTEVIYGKRFPIELHIQSMGGELLPTFYVCDLIKNLDTPVHIYIDGYVASAASLISICGEKRFMTKNSCILVHQLRAQTNGKLSEMKQEMNNLNQFMENLRNIYLNNSNITIEELDSLLYSEYWLSSQKCLELGFVDKII